MRIQTILNRVEKFKSFVYDEASTRGTGRRPGFGGQASGLARTASLLLRLLIGVVAPTITWRSGDSSSSPCGESWCSWPTGCGAWTARDAG